MDLATDLRGLRSTRAKARLARSATDLSDKFYIRRILRSNGPNARSAERGTFLLEYLEHKTNLANQRWWKTLGYHERQVLIDSCTFHTLERHETMDIYVQEGAGDRRVNPSTRVLLAFHISHEGRIEKSKVDDAQIEPEWVAEGQVMGQMDLPSAFIESRATAAAARVSSDTLRKSERMKYILKGPLEYIELHYDSITDSIDESIHQFENEKLLKHVGFEMLISVVKTKCFEPGQVIVAQDSVNEYLHIIREGEARAIWSPAKTSPFKVSNADTSEGMMMMPLTLASLGPQSCIGDIDLSKIIPLHVHEGSMVSIVAQTNVETLCVHERQFTRILMNLETRFARLAISAYSTLAFFLGRLVQECQVVAIANQVQAFLGTIKDRLPLQQFKSTTTTTNNRRSILMPANSTSSTSSPPLVTKKTHSIDDQKLLIQSLKSIHSPLQTSSLNPSLYRKPENPLASHENSRAKVPIVMGLFPTMTRHREYHGCHLPQLEPCHRGYESPNTLSSQDLSYHVFQTKTKSQRNL